MLHAVFNRPDRAIKVFDSNVKSTAVYRGEGDAWGWTPQAPYGPNGWCPRGHYLLGAPQYFDPIASEGWGQIPVADMDARTLAVLVSAKKATSDGKVATIGGIVAPLGQLAAYGRSAIMLHGGGSNAPEPYADYQMLCKTEGCTRMYNIEWKRFASWLDANRSGNTVILSVLGDPVKLPC